MRVLAIGMLAVMGLAIRVPGGELPAVQEKPFLGSFLGFSGSRDFDFAVGADAESELFFKERRERLKLNDSVIRFYYVLEEKIKDRWISRRMTEDGFETAYDATDEPEPGKPISFVATFTGETKVEIVHVFGKDTVTIANRIVDKKTENEVRVGVKIVIGDLYRHLTGEVSERELRSKIKKSTVTVEPVEGKKTRLDLDKKFTLQEEFPKGARSFSLKSDRIGGHEFMVRTEESALGRFEFRQTREAYHGFPFLWWPNPEKNGEKGARLVVEVK